MSLIFIEFLLYFQGFDSPHDLTVTRDGENVYVGEIKPNNLWKFVKEDQ